MTKHRAPPDPAQVIALRRDDLTIGEICQLLGCSRHAADKALREARGGAADRDDYREPTRAELAASCRQHLMDLRKEQAWQNLSHR